jgi:hypothetical protein
MVVIVTLFPRMRLGPGNAAAAEPSTMAKYCVYMAQHGYSVLEAAPGYSGLCRAADLGPAR